MKGLHRPYISSLKDDQGATAVEYVVLLALISVVIIASVGFLGGGTRDGFKAANTAWSNASQEDTIEDVDKKCGNDDSPDDDDCGHGND